MSIYRAICNAVLDDLPTVRSCELGDTISNLSYVFAISQKIHTTIKCCFLFEIDVFIFIW